MADTSTRPGSRSTSPPHMPSYRPMIVPCNNPGVSRVKHRLHQWVCIFKCNTGRGTDVLMVLLCGYRPVVAGNLPCC